MKNEVKNGDVFIFVGSNRRLMKLLHAEDGGMVMYVKRLEAGRFKLPAFRKARGRGSGDSGQSVRSTMYDMFFIEKSAGIIV